MTTMIVRAHKIRLDPTASQERHFIQACGTARFAYNWGLAEWNRQHHAGMQPSAYQVDKALNAVKRERFPWMREVSKSITQVAIQNVGAAFARHRDPKQDAGKPHFKKKGKCQESFVPAFGVAFCKIEGKRLWIPKLGWVRMRQQLRFMGKVIRITISRVANHWYAAVSVRMSWTVPKRKNHADGGLDVGITPLAVESDGTYWNNPKSLNGKQRQLRLWNRRLARRTKQSRGHRKAVGVLGCLHKRIADIRADQHHKCSTAVVRKYSRLGLESLHVKGLLKNRRLSRHLSDAALSGLLSKVVYKAQWYGCEVIEAGRWYPSSQICSTCGKRNTALTLGEKRWRCSCGVEHDRDLNAAINLRNLCQEKDKDRNRVGHTRMTPVDSGALAVSHHGETALDEAGIGSCRRKPITT